MVTAMDLDSEMKLATQLDGSPTSNNETEFRTPIPHRLRDGELEQAKKQAAGEDIFNIVLPSDGQRQQNGTKDDLIDDGQKSKAPHKLFGYLLAISASLSYSISLLFVKLLPVEDNLQEKSKVVVSRGLLIMLFCALSIIKQGHSFKVARGEYLLNFFRSIFGATGVIMSYVSIMYITLGESQTIINSYCIWTCLLSFIILRESLPISLILAMPMSVLGIILLAEPNLILDTTSEVPVHHSEFNKSHQVIEMIGNATTLMEDDSEDYDFFQHRLPGFAAAFGASLSWAIATIILKFRKKTPIATCTFYNGLGQVLLGLTVQSVIGFAPLPNTGLEWCLHAGIGIVSFVTQCLFQWGLLFVPAGTYSVLRALDIPFGFLIGAIFLNDLVLWTSVVGSIVTMAAVTTLVLNDQLVRGFKSFF